MELQNQDLAHIIVTLTQAKINEGYKMKSSMDDIISSKRSKLTLVSKTWTDIMCFLIRGTKDTTLLLWFPIPLQKKPTTNCVQIEKLFAKHLACTLQKCWYSKRQTWDFPGGLLVKNLLSNAEDAGSNPGWGTKIPHAVEQLSPHTVTTEPAHFNSRAYVPQSTEPTCSGACVPQLERSLHGVRKSPKKELLCHNKDPAWCN